MSQQRGRLLRDQLVSELRSQGYNLVADAVATALRSSRLESNEEGRTLYLRYGPAKQHELRVAERSSVLIAETLMGLDDGDRPPMAVRVEPVHHEPVGS